VTFRAQPPVVYAPDQITELGICRKFQNIGSRQHDGDRERARRPHELGISLRLWDVLWQPGLPRSRIEAGRRARSRLLIASGCRSGANVVRRAPQTCRKAIADGSSYARAIASEPATQSLGTGTDC